MTAVMGCIIVTYNSAGYILDCLQSLAEANGVALKLVLVDNASCDATVRVIEEWTSRNNLELSLIQTSKNVGFAAGVNLGLTQLLKDPTLDRFWILNPDCTVPPRTPAALASKPLPFALLGGRIVYQKPMSQIQIDGGRVNSWTGATQNINIGKNPATTPLPDTAALDFISGASMVASREFVQQAGLMPEQYFLYYEEVDWAQKRGELPLTICEDATVYHSAGASIGSPTLSRGPSPVSAYFKHRARMMFMAKHHPLRLPVAYLFGWGKVLQHALRSQIAPIPAILRALHGLPASRKISAAVGSGGHAATKLLIRWTRRS
ncbi:hypothetical protein BCF46_3225 [Litoreibacter meonggei]|uniref:Glycosyltransferase 2-like domain-containing protein n=1 Tax=Litoreibacter meonggei TaxID=1049199 RepID=A0A497VDQ8_9RHOB|nr:glycosyltransferase family 2 protein [Litoreibacter meonggei]RLJ41432.1 hypothetical protein BCF46_3225 [Litoreibacter meonggei]